MTEEKADDNTIDPGYRARVLARPISMVRIQTMDWDELSHLAGVAGRHDSADYAQGVRDALTWLANGVPTVALLEVLGE